MTPAAAALPEGGDGRMVEALLAREEFRALVAATEEVLAEPPEVYRKHLIILARQSLERALAFDDTAHAAIFVLEQEAHGRDPAVTLADGVLKTRARHQRPPPDPPPASRRPGRYRWDPLRAMMHRGAANLREDIAIEDALRTAASAAAAPRTTAEAARRALELKAKAAAPAPPRQDRAPPFGSPSRPIRDLGVAAGAAARKGRRRTARFRRRRSPALPPGHPGYPAGAIAVTLPSLIARKRTEPQRRCTRYSSAIPPSTAPDAGAGGRAGAAVRRRIGLVGQGTGGPRPLRDQIRAALEKSRVVVVLWTAERRLALGPPRRAAQCRQAGQCPPSDVAAATAEPFNIQHMRMTGIASCIIAKSGAARRSRP